MHAAIVLTLHDFTTMFLAAVVLSGLFLALAFVADAHVPLPPVHPVTKERPREENPRSH